MTRKISRILFVAASLAFFGVVMAGAAYAVDPAIKLDVHIEDHWELIQLDEDRNIETTVGGRVSFRPWYYTAEHTLPSSDRWGKSIPERDGGQLYVPVTGDIASYDVTGEVLTGVLKPGHKVDFQWYVNDTNVIDPIPAKKLLYGTVPTPPYPAPAGTAQGYMTFDAISNEFDVDTSAPGAQYYYMELAHTDPAGAVNKYYTVPVKVTITPQAFDASLLTPAEASGWRVASTSKEIYDFCQRVAAASNGRIIMGTAGRTLGRIAAPAEATDQFKALYRPSEPQDIPMLIIGNPAPATPADVPADKLVAFINCNIHSGEMEGKEGSLVLAREFALGKYDDLLNDVVVVIVPNLNADGNDFAFNQYNSERRAYPKLGGTRISEAIINPSITTEWDAFSESHNGYNVNRDMTKLDSPEARALVRIMNEWDPALYMDMHSGMVHYNNAACWQGAMHPDTDAGVLAYNSDAFYDIAVGEHSYLYEQTGKGTVPYGGLANNESLSGDGNYWESDAIHLRYTTNYISIRNRMIMLIESRAHDPYPVRVATAKDSIYSNLLALQKDKARIKDIIETADKNARNRAVVGLDPAKDVVTTSAKYERKVGKDVHQETLLEILTTEGMRGTQNLAIRDNKNMPGEYESRNQNDRVGWLYAGRQNYTFPYYELVRDTSIPMGAYYMLDSDCLEVLEALDQHGIEYTKLSAPLTIEASKFQWFNAATRQTPELYVAGRLRVSDTDAENITWIGDWEDAPAAQVFPAGTIVVSTAQPNGALAAQLLEPGTYDGFMNWNYDERIAAQNPTIVNYFDAHVSAKPGTVRANYVSDSTYCIPIFKVKEYVPLP